MQYANTENNVLYLVTGAIPELPKGQIIREVTQYVPYDPQKVLGCYSQSKAMATQIVLDAAREKNLNACVVFPAEFLDLKTMLLAKSPTLLLKSSKAKCPWESMAPSICVMCVT